MNHKIAIGHAMILATDLGFRVVLLPMSWTKILMSQVPDFHDVHFVVSLARP